MKRIILLLAMLTFSIGLFSCGGGGGSGSADLPPGENPGGASVVQLWPSHYIAQTNAYITLYAKVLDGNGAPVPNIDVSFTNLSDVGTLSKTSAKTDGTGLAQVTISSSTPGFSTILAQVNIGVGQVRDRKTVYFTTNDVLAVTMDMDVDSVPGNRVYNESSDFILFEPPPSPDDTFEVLATVRNAGGVPVAGESVTWSASHSEVLFVRTEDTTNVNGQAKGVFQVWPSSIRNTDTHINIMAYAGNGAANMVTLFLRPVVIDKNASYVTAASTVVDVGGTTDITAVVMLNTGHPAPDGVTVNFTTTCGTVTPFAQTTGGVATAIFTAPTTVPAGGTCKVTASVSGTEIGSVTITIKAPLRVIPDSATVDPGGSATYTIIGGVPSYNVYTSHQSITTVSPTTVTTSGGTFIMTNTLEEPCTDTTVTITVVDAIGSTATATYKIDCP